MAKSGATERTFGGDFASSERPYAFGIEAEETSDSQVG
jgi:hypothetical protein